MSLQLAFSIATLVAAEMTSNSALNLQPSRFSGTASGEDINIWLQTFEDFADDAGWDDVKKAKKLKLLVTGEAQVFVWELDQKTQDSYDAIKRELINFYTSKEDFSAMTEFEERRKRNDETWRQLCHALKMLYTKARSGHPKEIRNSAVKHQLLRTADADIRATILKADNVDSMTPEELANRLDSLQRVPRGNAVVVAGNSSSGIEDRLDKMQQEISDLVALVNNASYHRASSGGRGRGGRGRVRCFNCGVLGHFSAQCPRRQTATAITCFRCSGKGHRANVCPTPQKPGNF